MSHVAIRKLSDFEASSQFIDRWNRLFDTIRRNAFARFQERGGGSGRELDDWLAAEREALWTPPAELIETGNEYRVRVAMPGFDAGEIQVTVMGDAIVIEAESKPPREEGSKHLAEFGAQKLYRRLEFASPVDPEKVTATLDKGVLNLVAPKAAEAKARKIHVAAAKAS